jgi:threonine synthase
MRYHSTRGQAPILNFDEAVLAGLARDGGLYLPDALPQFSPADLVAMQGMDYVALATEVLWPFVRGQEESRVQSSEFSKGLFASKAEFHVFIKECYSEFRHEAVAPLKQLGADEFVLELFWGPTLAFKDFALQFLGRLLDKLLATRGEQVTIIGATSGDTGSAAIAGCRGRNNMRIVILHPHERTSLIQRRQMTTIHDANVHNIAIEGSFDDCQNIVKALFNDIPFRDAQHLTAVNSINWARIMAQTVYYFYAALALGAPARAVSFSVPTGNFGDIYAGYLAKRMGLPVDQLIVATNKNDILSRCINGGSYRMSAVEATLSPSMDIQISSNFERLLFDLHDGDAAAIRALMQQLRDEKGFDLPAPVLAKLQKDFCAAQCDDAGTLKTIAETYQATGEILDPHTAVGLAAGRQCWNGRAPLVVLATAHPAKFHDAVKKAIGFEPPQPTPLQGLDKIEEKFTVMPNDASAVKAYMNTRIREYANT